MSAPDNLHALRARVRHLGKMVEASRMPEMLAEFRREISVATAELARREAEAPTCRACGRPEADPMVVVGDDVPSLAGQRFHAACFRECLEAAVLELERRGVLEIDRGDESRRDP